MHPVISIIIPTRNRPIVLAEALLSVAQQKGIDVRSIEVVVVNDAGADVTDVVNKARDRGLAGIAVNLGCHRGLPTARNAGLDKASGEYIGFLDDDDVYLPGHLATLLGALDGHSDLVYSQCLIADRRVDPAVPSHGTELFDFPFHSGLLEVANTIPVHSAVLRNPRALGARYDAGLAALEDWDFWLRLNRCHNFRFTHLATPTVIYHRLSGDSSMTGEAGNRMACLAAFGRIVCRVWRRWPTTNPKATRYRGYLGNMYWLALAEFAHGRRPHFNYYLRSMKAIGAAWTGELPEAALVDALANAVKEETADVSAVA